MLLKTLCFVTVLSSSWASVLKKTKIKLELITYIDMLHVYENGIRQGIIRAIQCYTEVNNNMLTYDKSKGELCIVHLDCNSQYGWALSEPFLYRGYEYVQCLHLTLLKTNSNFGIKIMILVVH